MIIRPPPAESETAETLIRFGHNSDVLPWLEQNRRDILEMLAQTADETRFRQLQGAAAVIKELIVICSRTP